MKQKITNIAEEFKHILPNGKEVICNRPDRLHAKEAILGFYDSFKGLVGGSMWVIDIGTSCGDSTVVLGSFLNPDSRVLAFEPSREIHNLLLSNLSMNTSVTYDIHPVAAGDSNSMTDFIYGTDNGGLIIPDIISERANCIPNYKVQVVNTYQYLRTNYKISDLDKIGFIKIDTEGYDYVVLRGLAPLIYRNRMPIMIEWWNDPVNSNLLFDEIEKLYYQSFNSNGERVSRLDYHTNKRTQDLIIVPA